MKKNLKILILEDDQHDADLLNRELKKSGLSFTSAIVQTRAAFEDALLTFNPDLILSDYSLPSFDAATAFRIKQNKFPHIPFIIVSSIIGEENAVELIKNGVTDYVSKDKLFSLLPKINRALTDAEERKEKEIIAEKLKVQAAALIFVNKELVFQNEEKENRASELVIANKELLFQNEEKEKRAAELVIANKELLFQNEEKEKRAAELVIANKELVFQNEEKENRAAELVIADKELAFQNVEKENRAAELVIADKELAFQNVEKENRAAELIIASKELLFQNEEKENRAAELVIANKELLFQNEEKENRASELVIANKELLFQNEEKENRAAELVIANKELAFQNEEKENRAAELVIANKELIFQNEEKEKRAGELVIANIELAFQYEEKEKRTADLIIANEKLNKSAELLQKNLKEIFYYNYALDESAIIAITDQKGIIKKVNNNFCKIAKYSEEELIGQDHRIINSGYHTKEFIRDLWVTIANGQIWKGQFKNKDKNGNFYWVDTTIVPFLDEQGKPYQYLAIRVDITNRKEAEEYLVQYTAQLETANKELAFQNEEKEKRAAELAIANKELAFQSKEKENRAAELVIVNKELAFQSKEKENRAAELVIAYKELVFQYDEKENRAAELIIANNELGFQNEEKENRAAELIIANKELAFQNEEKENRAAELVIANKELVFQNEEKENRAAELIIANKELAFQNEEKENRAAELIIANNELGFQNEEKENRAAELVIANKELAFQNEEKENRATDLIILSGDLKVQQEELKTANKELHENAQLLINQEEKVRIINEDLLLLNQQLEERVEQRTKALAVSEKQFRDMMETIPQIAWTNTIDGEATFFNQRWYDYTGLDYDNSKGWRWLSVVHPDDLQSTLDEYKLILKNNAGGEFQNRKRRTDGIDRWHLIRLMPIKNEDGKVQLWTGTATDIHELKLLQQQKDDFISIASHELKTPITSLKASLQLLNRIKNEPTADMLPGLIEMANKSLEKVVILIKYLLDASNVNEGQLRLNQKLFTLSHVINECCHSFSIEGTSAIITEGDMELEVYADAERVNQVVINFVTNAIKYAPQSKEIRIRIEKVNEMAKVSVIDKGSGISTEKLAHLFDRYYRADNSGSQYSGLGLGLYISAEIIKKHGGQIGVNSELGNGSTFWFTLPTKHSA
ncbi:MAG: PAS domain S-box protein [Bacteroidota bacterium]|nr:PAS domain S-box protein [Bacteroidota bacterium]